MSRTRAALVVGAAAAVGSLVAGGLPSSQAASAPSAHTQRLLQGGDSGDWPGAEVPVGDQDNRGPRLAPLATAKAAVAKLGSGVQVSSLTRYGTPLSVIRDKGFLATGLTGSTEQIARSFLRQNAAVWGLSPADVDTLKLVNNEPLSQSTTAYSVSFNQTVKGLLVSEDGYVVVGVVKNGSEGKVAGVTSSLVPSKVLGTIPSTTPKISITDAVLAAAKNAGVTNLKASDLTVKDALDAAGFTLIVTDKLHQPQRTRLRVLPTTDRGAKLVYETDILDVAGGRSLATQSFVDAVSKKVLLRRDAVDTLAQGAGVSTVGALAFPPTAGAIQGTYTSKACSAKALLDTSVGDVTLAVTAAATDNTQDDITIRVYRNDTQIASFDTLSSPEAGTTSFNPPLLPTDKVYVAICPFDGGVTGGGYAGNYVSTDAAVPSTNLPGPLQDGTATGPATWRAFASNPQLAVDGKVSADDRYTVCSGKKGAANVTGKDLSKCNYVWGDVGAKDFSADFPSRVAYDVDPVVGLPTNTTLGNNAVTTNAQLGSSLTPGAPFVPPNGGGTRSYGFIGLDTFTDQWHTARCNPSALATPPMADINAAIINLFVGHNRAHDFSYRLGLTETRGAMQLSNFGKTGTDVAEGDPELGNAQNAAATQNAFTVTNQATGPAAGVGLTGRDNANQITLQDGVPGITNQYLFQPIVGFYAPCTDGDLDSTVFLHEYTHATSNRLIAGPATGLSGAQGGSMGESWSDLTAIEYLGAFGLAGSRGEDPFALGAYATGDPIRGIRDYNLAPARNPLNYSQFGFDTTGPEVHADGEIWNAIQMEIREALIKKYNAQYPYTNKTLQVACALGRTTTGAQGPSWDKCPGNRRYITYQYDAMILQANGAPSMVDMRDAELMAITMRGGKDYDTVYDAFAKRGLGTGASSKSGDDTAPVPSFASRVKGDNAHVTFNLVDAQTGKKVKASVFVGYFSARCRPVATTLGGDEPGPKADIVAGTYLLTVQGKGYGHQRFTVTFKKGQTLTQTLKLQKNIISSAYSPSVKGNTGAARLSNVLDDDEDTNGAFLATPVAGRQITVSFPNNKKQTFQSINVSALHHPARNLPEGGTEVEGRFTGVRTFDVEASGDGGATWKKVYTGPGGKGFFPSDAPRPVAPDLVIRSVKLPKPVTANAVRMTIRSNACTGGTDFNREVEDDASSPSDCTSLQLNRESVTIAEFQVMAAAATPGTVVVPPAKPTKPTGGVSSGGGNLPSTGASTGLALGGLGLLGLLGAAYVVRRKAVA